MIAALPLREISLHKVSEDEVLLPKDLHLTMLSKIESSEVPTIWAEEVRTQFRIEVDEVARHAEELGQ